MIGYLKGSIEQIHQVSNTKTIAIIEVNGVGYEVQVPSNIALTLGQVAQVFTHQQFREDLVALYGFASVTERDLFRLLIGVSGIGASIGIALIENLGTTELVQAIVLGSAKILAKTPGVGMKTAERLSVELKDKLKQWHDLVDLAALEVDESLDAGLQGEVQATLLALGYSDIEVRQALFAIGQNEQVANSIDLEEWLRWAIASLS
jgi:holliday junction DNA helicase RuvA